MSACGTVCGASRDAACDASSGASADGRCVVLVDGFCDSSVDVLADSSLDVLLASRGPDEEIPSSLSEFNTRRDTGGGPCIPRSPFIMGVLSMLAFMVLVFITEVEALGPSVALGADVRW